MAKILVVGSINMDLVVRVPHSPQPGETVLGGDFETFPGGKGANQAVAASRMGGDVTMVGRVGNDDFGDSLIQGLVEDIDPFIAAGFGPLEKGKHQKQDQGKGSRTGDDQGLFSHGRMYFIIIAPASSRDSGPGR